MIHAPLHEGQWPKSQRERERERERDRDRDRETERDREIQRLVPPQSHRFNFTSGPTKAVQLHTKLYDSKEEPEKSVITRRRLV